MVNAAYILLSCVGGSFIGLLLVSRRQASWHMLAKFRWASKLWSCCPYLTTAPSCCLPCLWGVFGCCVLGAMHAIPCMLCHHRVLVLLQGDLLNEVGNGVGQWANELSKAAAGAAEVLGGVVQKAGENIKDGKLVSTAGSHCNRSPAAGAPCCCCMWLPVSAVAHHVPIPAADTLPVQPFSSMQLSFLADGPCYAC